MPVRRWSSTNLPIAASFEKGALVLAVRPVQINPYWQHGGHAPIGAIAVADDQLQVNDQIMRRSCASPIPRLLRTSTMATS